DHRGRDLISPHRTPAAHLSDDRLPDPAALRLALRAVCDYLPRWRRGCIRDSRERSRRRTNTTEYGCGPVLGSFRLRREILVLEKHATTRQTHEPPKMDDPGNHIPGPHRPGQGDRRGR